MSEWLGTLFRQYEPTSVDNGPAATGPIENKVFERTKREAIDFRHLFA